jgi:hypothetical protein
VARIAGVDLPKKKRPNQINLVKRRLQESERLLMNPLRLKEI